MCLLTSLACGKHMPRPSLPAQSACALEMGATRPPPPQGQGPPQCRVFSRPPLSPLRASSRPCLWPWTSSLRRERSSHRACDPAPPPSVLGEHTAGTRHRFLTSAAAPGYMRPRLRLAGLCGSSSVLCLRDVAQEVCCVYVL